MLFIFCYTRYAVARFPTKLLQVLKRTELQGAEPALPSCLSFVTLVMPLPVFQQNSYKF